MGVTFPNESPAYRAARDKLLQREIAFRREMEAVAAEIRALPPGGAAPEDYEFVRSRLDCILGSHGLIPSDNEGEDCGAEGSDDVAP